MLRGYFLVFMGEFKLFLVYSENAFDCLCYSTLSLLKSRLQVHFDLFIALAYTNTACEVFKMHPLRP